MRLRDKVALVTGGAIGIGHATSLLFAQEGAKVVVGDIKIAKGSKTVRRIKEAGGEAVFVKVDVSKGKEVKRMVERAIRVYGRIDIVFNNAGIMPEVSMKGVADLSEEVWDHVMDVNLKGIFLTSKYAIPEMIKNGGGSIINMSSTQGHVGAKNRSVYAASKGGVTLLTRSMALDYAPYKIRVNCIGPAAVDTELTGGFLKSARRNKRLWKEIISKIPLGKLGSPEDIAYAALYLASDESRWVTGSSLMVDGGYTAQ